MTEPTVPQTKGQILAGNARKHVGNADPNRATLVSVDADTRPKLNDLIALHGSNSRAIIKKLIEKAHSQLGTDEISALRVLERARTR